MGKIRKNRFSNFVLSKDKRLQKLSVYGYHGGEPKTRCHSFPRINKFNDPADLVAIKPAVYGPTLLFPGF